MARDKGKPKPPSRRRYEENNPTISCRLTREDKGRLDKNLKKTGRSFSKFVIDALEDDESKVVQRIEMLAKEQAPLCSDDRLKCLEDILLQASVYLMDHKWPLYCPLCEDTELIYASGCVNIRNKWGVDIMTLKCPKCGYYLDSPRNIAPESLRLSKYNSEAKLKSKSTRVNRTHRKRSCNR